MRNTSGWIRVSRSIKDKGFYKDSEYVHLWIHILLTVNHTTTEFLFNGRMQKLLPGQMIAGRRKLALDTGISQSKIDRILKCYESEQQIEQQMSHRFRVLTVLNWGSYQKSEPLNEQIMNSKRATGEPLVNTYNECNKEDNEKNKLFETFRLLFPGTKRGLATEYRDFIKKHMDWQDVLPQLKISLENQIKIRTQKAAKNEFVPEWKHLKTWIHNRCWEEEAETPFVVADGTNGSLTYEQLEERRKTLAKVDTGR